MKTEQYRKVEIGEEIEGCKPDEETGFPTLHAWVHDGVIWTLPNEPPAEFPYLWACAKCGMNIRTRKPIPGFQLPDFPEETK